MRVLQRSRGGLRRSTKSKSAVRSIDPSRAANRGPSLTGIIKRHSRVYARAFRYRTMRDSATELNDSSRRDRRAKGKRDREIERERGSPNRGWYGAQRHRGMGSVFPEMETGGGLQHSPPAYLFAIGLINSYEKEVESRRVRWFTVSYSACTVFVKFAELFGAGVVNGGLWSDLWTAVRKTSWEKFVP